MTIKQLQIQTDDWIREYGVRYFNELTNMAVLTEEVGELARLMARQYGEQSFKTPMNQEQIKDAIADELSDVMFVITCLANQMDIDIEKAIEKNFKKKTRRDATRHQDNSKL